MRRAITILSLIGFVLFGASFSLTFIAKENIQQSATSFISQQVEKEVRGTLKEVEKITDKASQLKVVKDKYSEEIKKLKHFLSGGLPELVAKVVADILDGKIDQKEIENGVRKITGNQISSLILAISNIEKLISGKYFEILDQLIKDIRIFTGANTFLFLIMLAISRLKNLSHRITLLPTSLLLISTVSSSGIYVFYQDWFYTIVCNDYMGFSYLIYVGAIFLFQCDVVFLKGKITEIIFHAGGGIIPG